MTGYTVPAVPSRRFLDAGPALIAKQGDPFRPLEAECRIVQFGRPLSEDQLRRAGEIMADRADVWLRIHLPRSPDLAFLKFFPGLRKLDLAIYDLESLDGLSAVRDTLEAFHFDKTRKTFPLGFLATLPRLRDLALVSHKKEVDVLGRLTGLTDLALRGISLPDLSLLLPLSRLRALSMAFAGAQDLSLLPRFTRLAALYLLRIAKLSDLSVVAELAALNSLTLDWMPNVTALPNLSPLRQLETVEMESMKGLKSLEPVAAAPGLRRLQVVNMPQLKAADFACLIGHPSLEVLMAFPGGKRTHDEIKRMFPGVAK